MLFVCALLSSRSVHPHTRGEHIYKTEDEAFGDGSSPHTWGTYPGDYAARTATRFIPTHVGNMKRAGFCGLTVSVHPHTRGEHRTHAIHDQVTGGSSPHTWGTYPSQTVRADRDRFIPTHVGNIPSSTSARWFASVHPHTRGEHCVGCRGTDGTSRFIPTHVGNILAIGPCAEVMTVHPHTRGEHRGYAPE